MHTLRYRPAEGQDAAPLVAALHSAGYQAEPTTSQGNNVVVITSSTGAELDREQVRSVLENANHTSVFDGGNVQEPIRFEGES